jgi:methylated-DNA-[protein]-cysteine S-methyltransferase
MIWTTIDGTLAGNEQVRIYLAAEAERIYEVGMNAEGHPCSEDDFLWRIGGGTRASQRSHSGVLGEAAEQTAEYIAGRLLSFDLPLSYRGTQFQVSVWQSLTRIPFGETRSYGEVAHAIGNPGAMRAVGGANGRNNLPLFVPCHRVIAAGGKLGGFSGGVSLKKALLAHESAVLGRRAQQMAIPA